MQIAKTCFGTFSTSQPSKDWTPSVERRTAMKHLIPILIILLAAPLLSACAGPASTPTVATTNSPPANTPVAVNPTHTPVSYTHLRAHETVLDLVCRLLLEKKKTKT